jgi:cytochrome c
MAGRAAVPSNGQGRRQPATHPLRTLLVALALLVAPGLVPAETELDPIAPRLAGADAEHGKRLFAQCRVCHVAAPGAGYTVGPNLWGIIGRPVAAHSDYPYSDSLRAIGGNWDYEQLSRYLFDPKAMAPGGRMTFEGVTLARERADLIAYLRTLTDSPVALPEPPEPAATGPRYGGLPEGDGRAAVYFTCRACHALDQFTDRHLPRRDWDELLDEMIANNGMAAPEPWARRLMVDYLSTHFGQRRRRGWGGLPEGPGREDVYYSCKGCHSLRLVKQQGLSRERWDETLEWMVEEQGMDALDLATRERILDYLATHYGSG